MKTKITLLIFISTLCFANIKPDHFIFNKNINDYHAISFNPSYIHHDNEMSNFNFGFNFNGVVTNNALSMDWLNNSLFAGKNLKNENDKNKFLEVFNNENILISEFAQFQLGMNYKDYSFTVTPQMFGTFIIPYSIIDITFNGLEFDKNHSLNSDASVFQTIIPITVAHSIKLDKHLSKFNLPLQNVKIGFSTKLLLGMVYFESGFNNSLIDTNPDSVHVKGNINSKYSLLGSEIIVDEAEYGNSKFESDSKFGFPGKGFAIDLGMSADVTEQFNFGVSFNNLFGNITWDDASTFEYNMDYNLNISSDEFEDIADYTDEQKDSLTTSMITNESNKSIKGFKSQYPAYMLLNANYKLKDLLISSALLNPLNDTYYNNFEFSIGATYNRLKKLPLYFQYSINGDNSYKYVMGIHFNFKNYDLKMGFSQKDGFFNTSKGISYGISQTFKFNKKKKKEKNPTQPYDVDDSTNINSELESGDIPTEEGTPIDENDPIEGEEKIEIIEPTEEGTPIDENDPIEEGEEKIETTEPTEEGTPIDENDPIEGEEKIETAEPVKEDAPIDENQ